MGSGANPRDSPRVGLLSAWCHTDLSPVQWRILRAELWALWHAIILSEPGATFVSDCATVLRGLERGPKWCTAARSPHADVWRRIWDCFRDMWDEAHIDSVTRCKAHLSKAERAKLDEVGRFTAAGNERADELAKEGARDDSFQSILCDTYKGAVETCKAVSFILRAKGRERWPHAVAPPQGWDEKDERWKSAKPILARPHVLRRSGRQWHCEVCDKRVSEGAAKAKLVRTECVGHLTTALRARSQEYARSIRLLSSGWHRRRIAFLDHRNCSRCKRGAGGGKATKGTVVTGLGWLSSDKQ